jgi:exopolysaccharide production protein ExoQ
LIGKKDEASIMTVRSDISAVPLTEAPMTGLPFLVGTFLSFRVFIMLLSVRLFGMDPQDGTALSLACNFLLLGLVALQSLGSADHSLRGLRRFASFRWILVFLCFSGISLSWTVADSQLAALAYWGALVADVATVALLLRSGSVTGTIHALMRGYVWGACALAITAWLLPAQSDLRLGDEELLGANQIGYLCGFAFFFAQYLLREKVANTSIATVILGVTLLRSLSKTTIIAFIVAECVLLLRDTSMSRKNKLSLVAAASLIILAFRNLLTSYLDIYANSGNSPETLTGRLGIWAVFLEEAVQHPWMGHGFYSVWKVIPPFGDFEARHAHNELLQQFYLYGTVGIVMIFGLYGSFFLQAKRLKNIPQRAFFSGLIIFVLIRGLADTEVYDFSLPLWAVLMFSVLMEQSEAEYGAADSRNRFADRETGQSHGYLNTWTGNSAETER